MEVFHYKYGQCEQCGLSIEVVGLLQPVDFWKIDDKSNKTPCYLYVCESCFNSCKVWCESLILENCEKCDKIIEEREYYTNKEKEVICIDCKGSL